MVQRISILAPNLSENNLGRAYLLARVLQRNYEVEILGPVFSERIWPPVDDGKVPYITAPGCNLPMFIGSARYLLQRISGDIIYAVKPRPTSFGIGLIYRRSKGVPLLLDIDDWDIFGEYETNRIVRLARGILRLPNLYNNFYLRLMERLVPKANAITVVSKSLQARFGGVILPHGRDTDTLDPSLYDRKLLRTRYGLTGKYVLMFLGTPRPHKGVEDVIKATRLSSVPNICFVIVGVDSKDPYTAKLQAYGEPRLRLIEMQPWSTVPEFLAMADLVVLAQRPLPFSQAQVPAKVFDAMSMAKPIIATDVGDLPIILDDCGVLIPPGDTQALADATFYLYEHPNEANLLGFKARERCQRHYSWNVMEEILGKVIQRIDTT
jgi:glycosyltransferase involved in cell wall biosynthesis